MGFDTNVSQALAALRTSGTVEAAPEAEFDLRRLMLVVWRAKWLMALLAILGVGIAYAQLLRITPLYTAESRVLWEIDQANVAGLDPVARGLGGDFFSLASQIEVIKSGRLLERAVTDLKLAEDPVFNGSLGAPEGWTRWLSLSNIIAEARTYVFGAEAVASEEETPEELKLRMVSALRGAVEAEWLDGTYVLIIRMTTSDPERSAELANEMARFYILDQLETKFEATRQATDWLTERVADLRISLETAEQSVEDFSSGSTLISEEALGASARQLKDLRERATALSNERSETVIRLEAAEASRAAADFVAVAALMREPRLTTLAGEVAHLDQPAQNELREAMIAQFDADFERSQTRLAFGIERLDDQESAVRETIVGLEKKQDQQATALLQLRQLQREAEASRLIYEFFLSRLKETSVQEGIQRPDARMLTKAEVPDIPSSPHRGITLITGGGGGLLLALSLVFLFERLNASFRSTEELESRTGQAVIGTIPMAPVTGRRALLQYLLDKPTSSVAEAIRNLQNVSSAGKC